MIKKIAGLFAFAVITVVLAVSAGAAEFDKSVLDSVVYIQSDIYVEGEFYGSFAGSGFFVGESGKDPQYLLTNYHVVEYFLLSKNSSAGGNVSAINVVYDKNDYEECYIVDYDETKDIAIIKINEPTNKRKAIEFGTVSNDLVGKDAFAVGFPVIAETTVHSVSQFGKNDATVTSGSINRIITESGSGRQLLQIDVNIRGGNSGGPLVDENGAVIGINTLGSTVDNNLNYAVGIGETYSLLNKNNIPYTMKGSGFPLLIVLIIAAAVVAAAVIVMVIVMLTKKKSAPAAAAVGSGSAQPVPVQEQAPVSTAKPALHCMSAQHNGMVMSLSGGQPVTVGRDVSICRVVFKEGTSGISSRHCKVYFDANTGTFVLTDLGSTYGTFLADGQKLTPNVPYTLKAKDSFYLGERENTLYVDMEN